MRPLRFSINVTLDGCCDHRVGIPNEGLHRNAAQNIANADALLLGRVTYQMMESAWRLENRSPEMPAWMEPFARTIDAAKKYVVSTTLQHVDWNAELVKGDLRTAVEKLKQQPGGNIAVGGLRLGGALTELGLIDELELVTHPRVAGHGPYLFEGLTKIVDYKLVDREELGDGVIAMRYRLKG